MRNKPKTSILKRMADAGLELATMASYANLTGNILFKREPIRRLCEIIFHLQRERTMQVNQHNTDSGTRPLPCPFCSTEAMVLTWQTDPINGIKGTQGWRCGCLEPECDQNPFTRTKWKTEREAIISWNRRSIK